MWYGFLGGHLAFETFAKSPEGAEPAPRRRASPCSSRTARPTTSCRGVEIVGRGDRPRRPRRAHGCGARTSSSRYFIDDPDTPEADIDAIAEGLANKRVAIEIVPEKIVSWDHRKLGGTY